MVLKDNLVVGGLIPSCEIFTLLDANLAMDSKKLPMCVKLKKLKNT